MMTAKPIEDIYPLSPLQKSFLFHSRLDPASTAYLVQLFWVIEGPLDESAFRRAWEEIFRRHAILRTDFAWKNLEEPVQIVYRESRIDFERSDARGGGDEEIERLLLADRATPFDLGRAPLARLRLVRVRRELHYFLLSFHHILLDGWLLGVVLKEAFALYRAFRSGEEPVVPASRPYRDYVAWLVSQREVGSSEAYWRRVLGGFREPNRLSLGSGGAPDHREIHVTLSRDVSRELHAVARRGRLTLASLLQGLWALVVSRESGDDDVVFGATVSGRPSELAGVESMVGLFINTVPVRVRIRPETPFIAWLSELQRLSVDSPHYESVPPMEIQGYSDVPRGLPLYESLIVFQNYPHDRGLELAPDLTVEGVRHWSATEIPLHLRVRPGEPLGLDLVHDRSKVDDPRADSILAYLSEALRAISTDPNRRSSELLLIGAEASTRARMEPLSPRAEFTRFEVEPEASIARRFRQVVRKHPERIAIETDAGSWSYEALDRASGAVARRVAESLAGDGRVGLLFEHGAPMVVALLSTARAGKVYVPLDPEYPRRRLEDILSDSRPSLLLTNGRNRELARTLTSGSMPIVDIDSIDVTDADAGFEEPVSPGALAYLLYTSGSTGRPKGVMQSHENALHHVRAYTHSLGIDCRDRMTLLSSIGFDAAVVDVLGALLNGATLCPFDVRERGASALGRFLVEREISIYHSTPTVFRAFLETLRPETRFENVRLVVLGGEEVNVPDVQLFSRHFGTDSLLLNLYGATEVTLAHLHAVRGEETSVPLGKPVAGIETWLLDREGRRAARFGEIGIRSRYLALGYWNRPEETAERFLADPDDPARGDRRLYRTGDLGRLRADGTLEFAGRKDFLVKLRGQRVETGEVEAVLAESGRVSKSVVLAREIEGERALVAYVVPGSPAPTARDLRRYLADRLPDYMVPARIELVPSIPMTPTGKVDRRALPEPGVEPEKRQAARETPRTEAEELVAGIWSQVLRIERFSIRDNFFDLGGHSLRLTQVAARLTDAFGVEVPLRDLFDHPTIETLARRLESRFPERVQDGRLSETVENTANHAIGGSNLLDR